MPWSRGFRTILKLAAWFLIFVVVMTVLYCAPLAKCPVCRDSWNKRGLAARCELCDGNGRVSLMYKWTDGY